FCALSTAPRGCASRCVWFPQILNAIGRNSVLPAGLAAHRASKISSLGRGCQRKIFSNAAVALAPVCRSLGSALSKRVLSAASTLGFSTSAGWLVLVLLTSAVFLGPEQQRKPTMAAFSSGARP